MDTSTFIASIVGPLYIAVGIGIFFNADFYRKMVTSFVEDTGLYYFSGVLALVLGLVLINVHNLWVADWRVIITLIGWISLLKGLMRVVFPAFGKEFATSIVDAKNSLAGVAIVCMLFGVWLTYMGYGG